MLPEKIGVANISGDSVVRPNKVRKVCFADEEYSVLMPLAQNVYWYLSALALAPGLTFLWISVCASLCITYANSIRAYAVIAGRPYEQIASQA